MTPNSSHIVQKAHLKIQVQDKERAYEIQSQVIAAFQEKGAAALERELEMLCPSGQSIQLDRLQLDLGTIRLDEMGDELPRLIALRFREEFGKLIGTVAGEAQSTKISQTEAAASDLRTLVRFLETGTLGWEVNQRVVLPEALLLGLLEQQPQTVKAVLEVRLRVPKVWKRISLQFSKPLRLRLLELLQPDRYSHALKLLEGVADGMDELAALLEVLPSVAASRQAMAYAWIVRHIQHPQFAHWTSQTVLRRLLMEAIADGVVSLRTVEARLEALELPGLLHVMAWMGSELREVARMVEAKLAQHALEAAVTTAVATALRSYFLAWLQDEIWIASPPTLRQHFSETGKTSKGNQTVLIFSLFGLGNPDKTDPPNKKSKALSHPQKETPKREISEQDNSATSFPLLDDDVLYVENAGLALLNPFLQPCFEDLGWMEKGEFVSDEAWENAVLLTAYMACGENDIAEARLPLAKLLCGMELDRPVRAQVDLPDRALTEADNLLLAANGYWERAGKLTPAQFREAFLMREGRLKQTGQGWNLKVDRHTIDILLEFLPWSFGTIKLPWMPMMLTVDW